MKALQQRTPRTVIAPQKGVADALAEDRIRQRAFELYEGRKHVDGQELQDWLQAEAELKRSLDAA